MARCFNKEKGRKLLDTAQLRRGVVRKDEGESRPGVLKVRLVVRGTMTSTHIDVQSPTSIFPTFAFTVGAHYSGRPVYFVSISLVTENILQMFYRKVTLARRKRFPEILLPSSKRSDARILCKLIRLSRSFVLLLSSPYLYWILAVNNGIM